MKLFLIQFFISALALCLGGRVAATTRDRPAVRLHDELRVATRTTGADLHPGNGLAGSDVDQPHRRLVEPVVAPHFLGGPAGHAELFGHAEQFLDLFRDALVLLPDALRVLLVLWNVPLLHDEGAVLGHGVTRIPRPVRELEVVHGTVEQIRHPHERSTHVGGEAERDHPSVKDGLHVQHQEEVFSHCCTSPAY